jgi:hypothetical protein
MKKASKRPSEELRRLAEQPEERIDTGDIPEVRDWSNAERGRFYRPVKKQVTLRGSVGALSSGRTVHHRCFAHGVGSYGGGVPCIPFP